MDKRERGTDTREGQKWGRGGKQVYTDRERWGGEITREGSRTAYIQSETNLVHRTQGGYIKTYGGHIALFQLSQSDAI